MSRKIINENDRLPGLIKWMDDVIAKGKVGSARRWATLAGLSNSSISNIMRYQRTTAETVISLADAADEDRMDAFVAIGWIRKTDFTKSRLSNTEKELIEYVRHLRPDSLQALIGIADALQSRDADLKQETP